MAGRIRAPARGLATHLRQERTGTGARNARTGPRQIQLALPRSLRRFDQAADSLPAIVRQVEIRQQARRESKRGRRQPCTQHARERLRRGPLVLGQPVHEVLDAAATLDAVENVPAVENQQVRESAPPAVVRRDPATSAGGCGCRRVRRRPCASRGTCVAVRRARAGECSWAGPDRTGTRRPATPHLECRSCILCLGATTPEPFLRPPKGRPQSSARSRRVRRPAHGGLSEHGGRDWGAKSVPKRPYRCGGGTGRKRVKLSPSTLIPSGPLGGEGLRVAVRT